MATKSKKAEAATETIAYDQFIFVEVPAPSNDNGSFGSGADTSGISPDVMFTVGDYIFDFDDADTSQALLVALDGAESEAADYAVFSSSVMFVFGDAAAEIGI